MVKNPPTALAANWGDAGTIALDYAENGNDLKATAIPQATAILAPVQNQALTVETDQGTGRKSKIKLVFKLATTLPAAATSKVAIKLPNFYLSGTDDPTVEGCAEPIRRSTPRFATTVAKSGEANAGITFTWKSGQTIAAGTLCTITTNAATVVNPQTALDANWNDAGKISIDHANNAADVTDEQIPTATAIAQSTNAVSNQTLAVETAQGTGQRSRIKLVFKTNIMMPALNSSNVTVVLPSFDISGNTDPPTVEGCGTGKPVFTTAVANSGADNAAITFSLTTAHDIEPDT